MKAILILTLITMFSFSAHSKTQKAFNLFRTNYYPEKTMQYGVKVNTSCQLESKNPVVVYFIETSSGQFVEGFSKYNKEYFNPNLLQSSSEMVEFDFKSLKEVSTKAGSDYSLMVASSKNGSQCQLNTELLKNGKTVVGSVSRFEVEFELNFVKQPKGFKWVKALGSQNFCLVGNCK